MEAAGWLCSRERAKTPIGVGLHQYAPLPRKSPYMRAQERSHVRVVRTGATGAALSKKNNVLCRGVRPKTGSDSDK